jgi:hypothetical protein
MIEKEDQHKAQKNIEEMEQEEEEEEEYDLPKNRPIIRFNKELSDEVGREITILNEEKKMQEKEDEQTIEYYENMKKSDMPRWEIEKNKISEFIRRYAIDLEDLNDPILRYFDNDAVEEKMNLIKKREEENKKDKDLDVDIDKFSIGSDELDKLELELEQIL